MMPVWPWCKGRGALARKVPGSESTQQTVCVSFLELFFSLVIKPRVVCDMITSISIAAVRTTGLNMILHICFSCVLDYLIRH